MLLGNALLTASHRLVGIQVCINQQDVAERNAQVAMMGRIYSQTFKVVIWLGPGHDHVRSVFAFIRVWTMTLRRWDENFGMAFLHPRLFAELDHVMKTALSLWNLRLAQPSDGVMPEDTEQTSTPLETIHPDVFLKTVLDVFDDRPYWGRMWTFQELFLPEDGLFLCGHDIVVGVAEVYSVFFWLQSVGAPLIQQRRPEEISPSVWDVLHDLVLNLPKFPIFKILAFRIELIRLKEDEPGKVASLLRTTQFRQATNPRDLYYGVMGVLKLPLSVDYAAPVESVLMDASRMLCQGGSEMLTYLLAYAGSATPRRGLMLPSWATARGTIEALFRKEIFHMDSSAGGVVGSVSCGQLNRPRVSEDGQVLVCTGVILDAIESEAVKSYRRDLDGFEQQSAVDTADWAARVVDESITFFFDCPAGEFLSNMVARGATYAGGGSQFSALVRFWLQDHVMTAPNEHRSLRAMLDEDLEHNLILEAAQLFLLLCLLRDRDVERLRELQTKEKLSEEAFTESILRTSRFIVRGFSDTQREDNSAHGQQQPGDARNASTGTKSSETISWDDVLRFTSYQKRSNPPSQAEIDDYYLTNFHLAHAALLRTRKGYIGLGRAGIRPGDKVCVLAGANVPVILRPLGGQDYELVSYAFVVGAMHGEAWKLVETGEVGMEAFNLV